MSQDSPKRRILAFLGEWVVEVGTRLYGEHPLHTFIWETVQKDFFTIEYEGVIIISIDLLRRELARAPCPITFQS